MYKSLEKDWQRRIRFAFLGLISILTKMNNFWPRRAEPEGFSIERLAKNARQRIAQASDESFQKALERPKRISIASNSIENEIGVNRSFHCKSQFNSHWANRNFDEYRTAA